MRVDPCVHAAGCGVSMRYNCQQHADCRVLGWASNAVQRVGNGACQGDPMNKLLLKGFWLTCAMSLPDGCDRLQLAQRAMKHAASVPSHDPSRHAARPQLSSPVASDVCPHVRRDSAPLRSQRAPPPAPPLTPRPPSAVGRSSGSSANPRHSPDLPPAMVSRKGSAGMPAPGTAAANRRQPPKRPHHQRPAHTAGAAGGSTTAAPAAGPPPSHLHHLGRCSPGGLHRRSSWPGCQGNARETAWARIPCPTKARLPSGAQAFLRSTWRHVLDKSGFRKGPAALEPGEAHMTKVWPCAATLAPLEPIAHLHPVHDLATLMR